MKTIWGALTTVWHESSASNDASGSVTNNMEENFTLRVERRIVMERHSEL